MNLPALEIANLHAWHEASPVLCGIDMRLAKGDIAALIGPTGGHTGAGRSTPLRAILGHASCRKGSVRIHGTETIDLPPYKITQLGVGYCPQEGDILPTLSCEENLLLPPPTGALGGGMSLVEIYEIFPLFHPYKNLAAARLSQEEKQMLAIARILRTGATLLLLDGILAGLSPPGVQALVRMITVLKQRGYTMVIMASHVPTLEPVVDRFYVIEDGHLVRCFEAKELPARQPTLQARLGS